MVKRTKTQRERRRRALEMLKKGVPIEEIMRETKLNYQQITGLKGYLARLEKGNPPKPPQPKKRRGQGASRQTPPTEKPQNPTKQTLSTGGDEAKGLGGGVGVPPTTSSQPSQDSNIELGGGGYPPMISGELERELMVRATPILRKVILNPKVLLWYDYARAELGYSGDLGDFINDAVEDFWRSRGYKIKVIQEMEVS